MIIANRQQANSGFKCDVRLDPDVEAEINGNTTSHGGMVGFDSSDELGLH